MQETREYEQFSRRRFFEQLAAGGMPAEKIYEDAKQLNLNIYAQSYNLVVVYLASSSRGGGAPDRVYRRFGYPSGKVDPIFHVMPGVSAFYLECDKLCGFDKEQP